MLDIILFPLELFVTIVTYGAMTMIVICIAGLFLLHFIGKKFIENLKK